MELHYISLELHSLGEAVRIPGLAAAGCKRATGCFRFPLIQDF